LQAYEDTLRSIVNTQPFFLSDISAIIKQRGHISEPLPLPKDDIRTLRKQAFSTIKTLLEI
jgi:hypothetical protein